jgi:hypothetical protein
MTQLDMRPRGLPPCAPDDLIEEARRRHRRRIRVIAAGAILLALVVVALAAGIAGSGDGGGRSGGSAGQAPVSGAGGNSSHATHAGSNAAHPPSTGPIPASAPTVTSSPLKTFPPVTTPTSTTAPVGTVVTPVQGHELPSVVLVNGDQCTELEGTAAGFIAGVNLNYSCNSSSTSQFYAGGLDASSPAWTMQIAPSCHALPTYVCTGPLATMEVTLAQQ